MLPSNSILGFPKSNTSGEGSAPFMVSGDINSTGLSTATRILGFIKDQNKVFDPKSMLSELGDGSDGLAVTVPIAGWWWVSVTSNFQAGAGGITDMNWALRVYSAGEIPATSTNYTELTIGRATIAASQRSPVNGQHLVWLPQGSIITFRQTIATTAAQSNSAFGTVALYWPAIDPGTDQTNSFQV